MNAFFNQTAIKGIEQGHTVLCLQSTDLPDIIQRPREKWDQLLRKRLKNTDLQTVDKILIPANIRNKHWVLVVVDTRARTLALYDSLPQFLKTHTNDNPLQPIKNFLQSHPNFKDIHWTTKKGYPLVPTTTEWSRLWTVYVRCSPLYYSTARDAIQPPPHTKL